MITLRQKLFIIVSVIIAVLLAILLYLLYGRKDSPDNTAQNQTNQTATSTADGSTLRPGQVIEETPVLPPYSEDLYVRQLTKIFVERFGSNSTQNPNQNIEDSLELATPVMQKWMTAQMKDASRDYEGELTEVLASRLTEKTAGTATVAIEVQQAFEQKKDGAVGATSREIRQRKGRVTLVKSGENWLVDGLYWD